MMLDDLLFEDPNQKVDHPTSRAAPMGRSNPKKPGKEIMGEKLVKMVGMRQ